MARSRDNLGLSYTVLRTIVIPFWLPKYESSEPCNVVFPVCVVRDRYSAI